MRSTTRQTGEFPSVPVRKIGPYELLAELGQGSHAGVYLARRAGLERNFALKLMKHPEDAEGLRRFEREAQLAAKLDHPGIVSVVDFGRDPQSSSPYLVMDHVAGPSLEDRLQAEGALGSVEAGELVAQLAEALASAHELGIVHRDLKPANILIDGRTGRPRISDFGLARQGALRTSLTREGDVIGTPFYMSPEQVSSRPVDERSDVYGLGVILYRLLTGEHPYVSSSLPALAELICAGRCRPPSAHVPGLDPALERVCLRALSVDPAQRPADAGELARELREALAGEAPGRRGEGPSRAAFVALVAVDVALILLLALALVQVLRLRREGNDLRAELESQRAASDESEGQLARARERLEDQEGELEALGASVTRLQRDLDAAQGRTREAQDQTRRAAEQARLAQLEARRGQQRAAGAAPPRERPALLVEVEEELAGATRQEAEATIAALAQVEGAAAWRATLQKDLGLLPAAESTVAAALQAGERDPDLHVLRFQLRLLRSGGRLAAPPVQEALAQLLEALPADSAQARYARLIRERRIFSSAGIAELRELARAANKPYLLCTLATALTRSGPGSQLDRLAASVEAWRGALRADPYDAQAWFQLSYAYHTQWSMTKDPSLTKPVLVTLARARALNRDPTLWTYTGKAYLTMVDLPQEAVHELQEALRRARARSSPPHVQHAGGWLLVAYLRTGAEARARELAAELRRAGRPVARPIYQQLLGALRPPQRRLLQELYPPS